MVGCDLRLPLEERIQVRPGRVLPAARRPAHDGHAVSRRDHPASRAQPHRDDLRGRDAHLARNLHGRPQVPGRRRAEPDLPRLLDRPLAGQGHAHRREQGLQREQLARLLRPSAHRQDGSGRALVASEQESAAVRSDRHRSGGLHGPVHDDVEQHHVAGDRGNVGAPRVHLPGEQPVPEPAGGRSGAADLWRASAARAASGRGHAMTLRTLAVLALLLAAPAMALAQFGHPLKGQWSGEWGPKGSPNRLLLDIQWDGKEITGRINPGMDTEGTMKKVTFDYSNVDAWKVQIEGEAKDPSGKMVPVRVDGTLENLGAYFRVFRGTWSQGGQKGEFFVTRN